MVVGQHSSNEPTALCAFIGENENGYWKRSILFQKRHSAIVKIDESTNFFRVQTVKYEYKKKKSKQHYMKQLHNKDKEIEGDIGLR